MFKNANQRKFLFALDKDNKKQGFGQQLPSVNNAQPMKPMTSSVPKLIQPNNNMNPTSVPSLPGLDKLPKFGRIRNSLKNQFKGIK